MKNKSKGQAVVEYLIFLAIMAVISINLIKAIHGFLASNISGLAVVLSRELKSGVCVKECYFNNFENKIDDGK